MSKINRFEDIESWKSARKLTKQIYEITSAGKFTRDLVAKSNVQRPMSNVFCNAL